MIAPLEWRVPSLRGSPGLPRRRRFDDVADLDVVVVLERHAAFEAVLDSRTSSFVALQRLQRAFVDHHVVAQQTDLAPRLTMPSVTMQAGDVADLGDAEDPRICALPRKVSL